MSQSIPKLTFQELSQNLINIKKFYPESKGNISLMQDINYFIPDKITKDIKKKIVLIQHNLLDFPLCPFCHKEKLKVSGKKLTVTCLSDYCRKEEIGLHSKNVNKLKREDYIKKHFKYKENLLFINNLSYKEFNLFKKFLSNIIPHVQDENIIISNFKKYREKSINERKGLSKENYILRFGQKEGIRIYNIVNRVKSDDMICNMRYSKLTKDPSNLEYWINLGFSKQSAEIQKILHFKYTDNKAYTAYKRSFIKDELIFSKSQHPQCKEYWMFTYNYSEKEAIWAAKNWWNKNLNWRNVRLDAEKIEEQRRKTKYNNKLKYGDKSIKASKASLKVFIPLIKKLLNKNIISNEDYYIGFEDKNEYFIANSNKFFYSYDFTIPKYNIIIEFNGKLWHPRKNDYDGDYNNDCYFGFIPAEKELEDKNKINQAKLKGFYVLEIWDYDTIDKNIDKCYSFIMENIKNDN